jgi:hypothetical protein
MPKLYLDVNLGSQLALGHSFTKNGPFRSFIGENYSGSREEKTDLKNHENRPEVPTGYV